MAAEEIATKALAKDQTGPPVRTLRGREFKSEDEWVRPMDDDALGFFRDGEATLEAQFDGDGETTIRVLGTPPPAPANVHPRRDQGWRRQALRAVRRSGDERSVSQTQARRGCKLSR